VPAAVPALLSLTRYGHRPAIGHWRQRLRGSARSLNSRLLARWRRSAGNWRTGLNRSRVEELFQM
jgi:hypothetical protein